MPKVVVCFAFAFLSFYFNSSGQNVVDPATWKNIDSVIRIKKNLNDIQNQLINIKIKAIAEHNDAALARCLADLLLIEDQKTEDSLFFQKSAFMDSILTSSASSALLKSIMHLLLARRINEFENNFYYYVNKSLIRTGKPGKEYFRMDRKELDSLVAEHMDKSIGISKQLERTNLDELLWLSSDPLIFLFRPDYTDLLYGERIFMARKKMDNHEAKSAKDWLAESQDEFIKNGDQIKTFNKDEQILFQYFHEWILYHLVNKPEAAYFIESLARRYLYQNLVEDSANKVAYEKYLDNLLVSPYNAVAVHAVYQLCKIWYAEAAKYNPTVVTRDNWYGSLFNTFDSSFRLHYNKTLQLMSVFESRLDSFSYIKVDLMNMRAEILEHGLVVKIQNVQIPDSAFPAMLQYRNISHLYTRIIRINPWDALSPNKPDNINRFMKMPAVVGKVQALILPDDHQWHNSFIKWDALAKGRYIILYSDTVISGDIERINFIDLSVSNLAVINNDQRLFVLNRTTGFPVKGATVLVTIKKEYKTDDKTIPESRVLSPKIINEQGYVVIPEKNVDGIQVYFGNDSITASVNEPENSIPSGLFDKESDDDLGEYYEDNIRLNIFTDRAIYRPGQTVFFKGIFTVPNPKTGEIMVLNFKNLQFPFFKNLFYKAVLKFKKLETSVTINDPFNKTVDSFRVTPNEFGSFSGSYTIPKNAATGEWDFATEYYEMEDYNSGRFQVEEYKRPSFKLVLTKPKNELKLGDSFNIQVKVRSFAGAPLSHVRLQYHVSRYLPGEGDKEILKQESFSNELGEFKILINDSSLHEFDMPDEAKISVHYEVKVEALDETGESHEQNLYINLSNRPVNINLPVPEIIERNKMAPVIISLTNEFSGPLRKPLEIYIYKMISTGKTDYERRWPQPDIWIENKEEWQKEFPDEKFDGFSHKSTSKTLVYKTRFSAEEDTKLILPADILAAGSYRIEAVCNVNGQIQGEASREFGVYDTKSNSFPDKEFDWMPVNSAFSGDTLKFISGYKDKNYFSIYHLAYHTAKKNGLILKYDYIIRMDKKGLNELDYKIPKGIVGDLFLTHLFIVNNQLYSNEHRVMILNTKAPDPDIVVEKYRTQISPGEKETFVVSIKTNNTQEAAELMTTMYDASLDELEPHKWEIPRNNIYFSSGNNWNRNIAYFQTNKLYEQDSEIHFYFKTQKPIWWISSSDLLRGYHVDLFTVSGDMAINGSKLEGRVAGLSVVTSSLLNVVVTGYGVSKRAMTGAVTTIHTRGTGSLGAYFYLPMVIIDGAQYTGDVDKINPENITQGIILKGADAVALYGSSAADGVLILSTHGPVILPSLPEPPMPPLLVRKNFAESAFFYPAVHVDKNGMYSISFTLPESVTEWKWKLFAHTRKAGFAYLEKSLVSQLPLMVQPLMPRFLYQGDKIIIKTRITNLDTINVAGQLHCLIEDLVTGEDISSKLLKETGQTFDVKRESNTVGSFALSVPTGLLHPLKIKISGATKTYSDGEEHIIPILSRKFLLSQTKFIKAEPTQSSRLSAPNIPEDSDPFGLSLFISPKPQSSLMNALTYLAFDPYGCSEQTVNKMLAYAMAIKIFGKDSILRKDISKIPGVENTGTTGKEGDKPDEQTMPWLQLRNATAIRQQNLRKLFDTAGSRQAFGKELKELMAMQNANGGLSWFKGGRTDDYISGYVLAGLGKMQEDNLLEPGLIKLVDGYPMFLSRLINYVDDQLLKITNQTNPINLLYARSYWLKIHPAPALVKNVTDSILKLYWTNISNYGIDQQSTLIVISLRFAGVGDHFHDQAVKQLESISQLAISDSLNGIRWKAVSNGDDLDRQDEETVARIAEAFETAGTSEDIIRGIVKWILKTRNEHSWTTTKSTGAIVGLLPESDLSGATHQLTAKMNDSVLNVTDDLFGGQTTGFLDLSGKKFPSQVSIHSNGSGIITGGIKYYYFSSNPPEDSLNNVVKIHKTLSRYNKQTEKWEPIVENGTLQIGDKVKTRLTINTSRQLNYVFINERRAATMEPRETESGYKYEGGLEYYQSVKDAGYLFFVDKIPSGIHNIEYETVINASGNFTNGPASLQCMYQPSVNGYSNIETIDVSY